MAKQPGASPRVWARSSAAEAHSPHRPLLPPWAPPPAPPWTCVQPRWGPPVGSGELPCGPAGPWSGQVRTTCRLLHPEPWASPPIKCTETDTHRVPLRPGRKQGVRRQRVARTKPWRTQGVRCQRVARTKPWRTHGQHQPHPPREDPRRQTLWEKRPLAPGIPQGSCKRPHRRPLESPCRRCPATRRCWHGARSPSSPLASRG